MTEAPVARDEEERLAVLEALDILDTAPEKATDDIAELAADIAGTPIALISLVDRTRQWFKACIGLGVRETTREHSFCAWCVFDQEPLVVSDAARDPRFATNPLVTDAPHVRFYAGFPLVTRDGYCLGSLCVIDREPRELEDRTHRRLTRLADVAVEVLEARSATSALATALAQVDALGALLPVCARCGELRIDDVWRSALEHWRSQPSVRPAAQGLCAKCLAAEPGAER
jgi:GAF domain-containing protein